MVDAITGASTGWTPPIDSDDDEVRRRAAAASTTKAATAPPEVPQGPDVNGALLVRAAQAQGAPATAKPLLAMGIDATAAPRPDQDTAVQNRMNAFFQSAAPKYRLPAEGGKPAVDVAVATPFRMEGPRVLPDKPDDASRRYVDQEQKVLANRPELTAVAGKLGISPGSLAAIQVGRGTPRQVHALTQALIDSGKLPLAAAGESNEVRVRRMMGNYGIGFDCAGFTQQALLAAHGITRAQAGLDPRITNESLSKLSPARFSRVAVEDARAGDVLALGPPPGDTSGHRLIVFERHEATPEELGRYCASGDGAALVKRPVTVLSVDSSYGSGGLPAKGGVQRQTWLYDGKNWGTVWPAHVDEEGRTSPQHVRVHADPYDGAHPFLGVYHYKGGH